MAELMRGSRPRNNTLLLNALEVRFGGRLSREQQDAQEFAQLLLESLLHEYIIITNDFFTPISISLPSEFNTNRVLRSSSFVGHLETSIVCPSCKIERRSSSQPFMMLSVCAPDRWSSHLDDCIKSYFSDDLVQSYVCWHCTLNVALNSRPQDLFKTLGDHGMIHSSADNNARKRDGISLQLASNKETAYVKKAEEDDLQLAVNGICERLSQSTETSQDMLVLKSLSRIRRNVLKRTLPIRLPFALILHINRSIFDATGDARRNNCSIEYTTQLSIMNADGHQHKYKLRSFITHHGSHRWGHYICYRHLEGHWWLEFNDAAVRRVSQDKALGQGRWVYMLEYESI